MAPGAKMAVASLCTPFFLVMAALGAPSETRLDRRAPDIRQIEGGTELAPQEFALLQFVARLQNSCGAAIIAEDWAITAAHCVTQTKMDLVVGTAKLSAATSDNRRQISESWCPEEYLSSNNPRYDVALLRLSEPANSAWIATIGSTPASGDVTLLGWGEDEHGVPTHDELLHVEVEVLADADCPESVAAGLPTPFFCAGESGSGACNGDSGGPVVLPATGELVGVIVDGCSGGRPGLNLKASELKSWIASAVSNGTPDRSKKYCRP